jgi:hypothetical protein
MLLLQIVQNTVGSADRRGNICAVQRVESLTVRYARYRSIVRWVLTQEKYRLRPLLHRSGNNGFDKKEDWPLAGQSPRTEQ